MGGRLGGVETDLVGHSTGTAVLDSVGRVGVDEVILLESEPVNVDLECGSGNDLDDLTVSPVLLSFVPLTHHDGTTGETRSGSSTSLIGRKEE
jgi:hypothetical protein